MRLSSTLPLVLLGFVASSAAADPLKKGKTRVESMPAGGPAAGAHASYYGVLSSTGRYLAFRTDLAALTGHGSYPTSQIVWKDRETGVFQLVSATKSGLPADQSQNGPWISDDGRYVLFHTRATGLPDGISVADVLGHSDVFRTDTQTGTTIRVSVTHDTKEPDSDCFASDMSADGRYVVFISGATNLVPGSFDGTRLIYRKDTWTGSLELVSVAPNGDKADGRCTSGRMSDDGQLVVFASEGTNLGVAPTAANQYECWIRDLQAGTTEFLSATKAGGASELGARLPRISGDGRYVAFTSSSKDLPGAKKKNDEALFVLDRKKGKTVRVPLDPKTKYSVYASNWSAGRYVALGTYDLDHERAYVYDAKKKKLKAVDLNSKGKKANDDTISMSISGNGKFVTITSDATNLGKDGDQFRDVFVRRWK